MPRLVPRRSTTLVLVLLCGGWAAAAERQRFSVRRADGTTLAGRALHGLDRDGAMLTLDSHDLSASGIGLRWIRDHDLQVAEPSGPYVEFFGGDRLPGEVTAYQPATAGRVEDWPDVYLVRPAWEMKLPTGPSVEFVRVLRKFVKRIVWKPLAHRSYEPNRAFLRDGRSLAFVSLRPDESGFKVLTADGPRQLAFAELAELHLPAHEPWDVLLDELAALSPDGSGTLVQLCGASGFAVTTAVDRLANRPIVLPPNAGRWLIGVQPAWSVETLWLPSEQVALRCYFTPPELPLNRLIPTIVPRPTIFSSLRPRVDRNAAGDRLSSGGAEYQWGFGMGGGSELRFPLHEFAVGFRTRLGLDARAGNGGCVKARVLAGEPPAALHETGFVIGAAREPEAIQVDLRADSRWLVLQVDMAHEGRPAGADPFDVRDLCDWLEPVLRLDAERLKHELRRRAVSQMLATREWQPRFDSGGEYRFNAQFDAPAANRPGQFRWAVTAVDRPFVLAQEISITAADRFLLATVRGGRDSPNPPRLTVRVDGAVVAELDPPAAVPGAETIPLVVPLLPYRGRKVRVEFEQQPGAERGPLAWTSLQFGEQRPTLRSLFDDEERFTSPPDQPPATRVDEPHAGEKALRVPAGSTARLMWSDSIAIRANPQLGEFRFLRLAVRKAGLGRVYGEFDHTRAGEKTVRFDAGRGEPCLGEAKRAWTLNLPSVWMVVTIDLFAEFGPLDLTGLTLGVPDGEQALFDQVYLGRTAKDLDDIPARESAEETNRRARTELAKRPLDRGLPLTVAIDFGGRWGTGVVIDRQHVLTAGHGCVAPGKDATVFFADKSQRPGKTLGIDRQLDAGLIRLGEPVELPAIEFAPATELPPDELYLGVTHQPGYEPGQRPAAYITTLRPPVPDAIGTFFELPAHFAGGPLFDREGRLLGIHTRRGRVGGFLYTRIDLIQPILDRLREPKITGTWALGSGPMLGVNVGPGPDGCRVLGVIEDSPAAKADVQRDDVLEQADGQAMKTLEDLQAHVADKDPGHKVKAIFRRGQDKRQIEFELMPRVP